VDRGPGTGTGTQPTLVILVSFANQAPVGTTEATWANTYFGPAGSANAYYQAASFGHFGLSPAAETGGTANNGVVGWLQLPYNHPDFGNAYDARETKLSNDAVLAADPYVDYASYDTNKDGTLEPSELHVVVITAGYETSFGGVGFVCGPSVWGHEGGQGSEAAKADDVAVNQRGGMMFGEWMCASNNPPGQQSSIGLQVHEFGHDIGFPDLYDTDYSSQGLGEWSIMSFGSYASTGTNFPGTQPVGPDAWSKSYQGWINPLPIAGAVNNVVVPSAATNPIAYQLRDNPGGVDWAFYDHKGKGEYFLVENRQPVGLDVAVPGCGLLIYHVDEMVTETNDANANDTHRLLDVEEASGTNPLDVYNRQYDATQDPFPGSLNRPDFNGATAPSSTLYSGAPSGVAVHANTGCADAMSANLFVPLVNDAFAAATVLRPPSGQVTGGNNGATKEAGEPAVAGNPGGATVWWKFRAPATGKLRVSTAGSSFDTILGVFKGASVAAAKEIAGNDNASATDPTSLVVAKVKRGKTYRIAVDGLNAGAGPSQGAVSLTYDYAPVNDAFKRATSLKGKKGKKGSSTIGASRERKEPKKVAGKKAGQTVWYKYKAKQGGRMTIDLSGSKFNTVLGVYTGSKVKKLHKVAQNDNGGKGKSSRLSFRIKKGQTYRILVAGVKNADGSFRISWHL
jgi:M6 family metalloprotease-like protein